MSPAVGFVFSALLVGMLVPIVMVWAHRTQALAPIDFRRRERIRKSLLGGSALIIGFMVTQFLFYELRPELSVASFVILLFGCYDDYKSLKSKTKFLFQVLIAIFWVMIVDSKSLILSQLGLSEYAAMALSAFWIVGMMNAVNMIDGMDGLASSFGLIAAFGLSFFAVGGEFNELATVAGVCLGFLVWNFPPAKIYLGDSGSQFLGFFLSAQALTSNLTFYSYRSILLPMLVLALPQMDAILAMYRRSKLKTRVDRGDHDHVHHKLQKLGLSVPQSLFVLVGSMIYASLAAFVLKEMPDSVRFWMVFGLSVFALIMLLGGVLYLEWKLAHQASQWSGTLLSRHLADLLKSKLKPQNIKYQIVVFDLFQYYKELQHRGIHDLHKFVDSFAKFIQGQFNDFQICTIGAYSIAVMIEGQQVSKELIIEKYNELIKESGLQITEAHLPWGLHFYLSEKEKQQFRDQYAFMFEPEEVERIKVAS